MVSQLRIYTINRGMMDSFIKLFEEHIRPIHQQYGMPVENAWVNDARTEFIWVRRFTDGDDPMEKEKEYFATPERKALGDFPTSHVAKMEVRLIQETST